MKNVLLAAAAILLAAGSARADQLGTRRHQRGAITHIDQGVFQLGIDSTLLVNWSREGDSSASRSHATGNVMLRYFLRPRLGVSGRLGGLLRKSGETRDLAFAASGWANYFMRLGEGMFFAPGLGAGLVAGQRDIPGAGGMVLRESLLGARFGTEILLAMYLSERFSLSAGPSFELTAGTAGASFVELDGSFKVGAVYSF